MEWIDDVFVHEQLVPPQKKGWGGQLDNTLPSVAYLVEGANILKILAHTISNQTCPSMYIYIFLVVK